MFSEELGTLVCFIGSKTSTCRFYEKLKKMAFFLLSPRAATNDKLKRCYSELQAAVSKYRKDPFNSYPKYVNEDTSVDSVAFSILCVVDKIRPAMLFQSITYEGKGSVPKIFETNSQKLQEKLSGIFDIYAPYLTIQPSSQDLGDFFILQKEVLPEFRTLKRQKAIVEVCSEHSTDTIFRFTFNKAHLDYFGGLCSEQEGLNAFTKYYALFQQMKRLARIVEGQVHLNIRFN
jgi:hypothetical protein